jgi:hypothetical protein
MIFRVYFGVIMITNIFKTGLLIYVTEVEPFLLIGFPKDASSHLGVLFDISSQSEIIGMNCR